MELGCSRLVESSRTCSTNPPDHDAAEPPEDVNMDKKAIRTVAKEVVEGMPRDQSCVLLLTFRVVSVLATWMDSTSPAPGAASYHGTTTSESNAAW